MDIKSSDDEGVLSISLGERDDKGTSWVRGVSGELRTCGDGWVENGGIL